MQTRTFQLYPHPEADRPAGVNISGIITRDADMLKITYELSGPIERINIPEPQINPIRKGRLWEDTCFEFFFRANGTQPYREVNLSPSCCWNVYRFDDYRNGMTEETALSQLALNVSTDKNGLQLEAVFDLKPILPAGITLRAAVSTVVKSADGNFYFFALAHPGKKPDFHHPDSFVLEL